MTSSNPKKNAPYPIQRRSNKVKKKIYCLEQNIQAATACESRHDTRANSTA